MKNATGSAGFRGSEWGALLGWRVYLECAPDQWMERHFGSSVLSQHTLVPPAKDKELQMRCLRSRVGDLWTTLPCFLFEHVSDSVIAPSNAPAKLRRACVTVRPPRASRAPSASAGVVRHGFHASPSTRSRTSPTGPAEQHEKESTGDAHGRQTAFPHLVSVALEEALRRV